MRKELFVIMAMVGFLLWGGATANAVDITWHMLTHSSLAGHGPGADQLIGTSDDTTTGEANNCNFTTDGGCAGSATVPAIGSYGYSSIEMDGNLTHSCLGGDQAGAPCVCADLVTECTANDGCPGALCSPADCCPPLLGGNCIACAQNDPGGDPFAPPADGYTYGGSSQLATGTVTTCQEADPVGDTDPPTDFEFKAFLGSGGDAWNCQAQAGLTRGLRALGAEQSRVLFLSRRLFSAARFQEERWITFLLPVTSST